MKTPVKNQNERGITLLVGTLSLLIVVPMMGLGVDVGFMFSVKSRLQAAVDGSALAAARALNIGQTIGSQEASAKNHAVNWFYANFPNNYFGSYDTVMSTTNVSVFDDPNNPRLRHVTVTASTKVDTFFMKWFGYSFTGISAVSDASRRDAVIMMVLDRSGSMGVSCTDLRAAAKLFTGQFAAGRDSIGMVSFSDGTYMHSAPTTNFQSVLGYTNDSGNGTGAIDNIACNGGTGTAGAVSLALNELYKKNLPGALNIIMLETDGLPNTLALNFWDSTNSVAGISSTSNCLDNNEVKKGAGGFASLASLPSWTNGYATGTGALYPSVPAGIIGGLYANDPNQGAGFITMFRPWQSSATGSNNSIYLSFSDAPGCAFTSNHNSIADLAWAPAKDVWGNDLLPTTHPYKTSVTFSGSHVSLSGSTSTAWTNYRNGVLNATDNAAYRARTNPTFPVFFFAIGLGGNGGVDYTLLQRMANDPNGDLFNNPPNYTACAQATDCYYYDNQPQGVFIYSVNRAKLTQAFLSVSSQILRLSR